MAGLRKDCQDVILEGCSGVVWESYKVDPYVKKMADQFYAFQDRVEELLVIDEEVDMRARARVCVSLVRGESVEIRLLSISSCKL